MAEEPARNLGAGERGESRATSVDAGEPATRAEAAVDRLGELYWQKAYGGRDAFDCLVRTILSQNTSDAASQPAYDALVERYDPAEPQSGTSGEAAADLAEALAAADRGELAGTIAPAGLQNQKAEVLQDVAADVLAEFGSAAAFDEFVADADHETVRERLLAFDGVGPKTADCVLLFAGGHEGVFPVDTHVHRIYRRLGVAPPDADHEAVRATLEAQVPAEKCGFGHTASIQFGREYCTARSPACLDGGETCPLSDVCDRIGVDPETSGAVDPADVASSSD